MLLLFLSSSKHKMYVRGRRAKAAVCERCDAEYVYEIERDVVGEDNSLFSWDERAAFRKAEADGQKKLDKMLTDEDDAVPCPNCGWVQTAMIEAVRKQSYTGIKNFAKGGFYIALVGLALAVVLPTLAYFAAPANTPQKLDSLLSIAAVGLVIMLIGLTPACPFWALRKFLNWRYDPNRHYFSTR